MQTDYQSEARKRHQHPTHFNYTQKHRKSSKSRPINRGLTWQPDLFESSHPVVTLEPVPNRAGRVRLTINQLDCHWELIPNLKVAEAKALLEFIAAEGIAFDLDLNEGCPIESERLHWATEQVIGGGVRL